MEKTYIHHDSFIDFEGKTHQFTVAAVYADHQDLFITDADMAFDTLALGVLTLGVAVCNTSDSWNEKKGALIATGRARKFGDDMLVINSRAMLSLLSEDAIKGLLADQASYVKDHVGKYIPGYDEMKRRYEKAQQETEIRKNLSDAEKQVLALVENNGVSAQCKELLKKSL